MVSTKLFLWEMMLKRSLLEEIWCYGINTISILLFTFAIYTILNNQKVKKEAKAHLFYLSHAHVSLKSISKGSDIKFRDSKFIKSWQDSLQFFLLLSETLIVVSETGIYLPYVAFYINDLFVEYGIPTFTLLV